MELPWDRLDVVTWSWQKALGGEGGHGRSCWTEGGGAVAKPSAKLADPGGLSPCRRWRIKAALFQGDTINTPSLLCVEDAIDSLGWAESIGGLPALIGRTNHNFNILSRWVERCPSISFLAVDPAIRSTTWVCLKLADQALEPTRQTRLVAEMTKRLEAESPPSISLRIDPRRLV